MLTKLRLDNICKKDTFYPGIIDNTHGFYEEQKLTLAALP